MQTHFPEPRGVNPHYSISILTTGYYNGGSGGQTEDGCPEQVGGTDI